MKRIYLFILAFALLAAAPMSPLSVSLVAILAIPEKYDNQFIRVEGYLHNKFEDSALYLSKEDGDYIIGKNALWVTYSADQLLLQSSNGGKPANLRDFDEKYVLLEGYVDSKVSGHLGSFRAGLKQVTRVMELARYYGQPNKGEVITDRGNEQKTSK